MFRRHYLDSIAMTKKELEDWSGNRKKLVEKANFSKIFHEKAFTLAPIWLPHWPACRWTISLMLLVLGELGGGRKLGGGEDQGVKQVEVEWVEETSSQLERRLQTACAGRPRPPSLLLPCTTLPCITTLPSSSLFPLAKQSRVEQNTLLQPT